MKRRSLIFLIPVIMASCTQEKVGEVPMELKSVGIDPTRTVIESSSFDEATESSLGLFLKAADGVSNYNGQTSGFNNVRFSKPAGSTVWSTASQLSLTSAQGTVFAYYPYASSITDITSVPVVSSINGDDYLYAVPVQGVNNANPSISLTMKHALALVSVKFVKSGSYSGNGELTSLSLTSAATALNGTLDAKTGAVQAAASTISFSSFTHQITASGITEAILAVPAVSSDAADVTMRCVIDGNEYVVALLASEGNGVKVAQGVKSTVTLTLKGGALALESVSVEDWNTFDGTTGGAGFEGSGLFTVAADTCVNGGTLKL